MIPLLLIISFISFMVMHFAPGDPVAMYINPQKRSMSVAEMNDLRHKLGFDRPVLIQYVYWLGNTAQGNWGYSLKSRAPVTEEIFSRLPNTLLLGGIALLVTLVLAIPIGMLSAIKRYSVVDFMATIGAFIGISIPGFWFALLLIQVFANHFHLLPSVGMQTFGKDMTETEHLVDVLQHLVLPVIALSVVEVAYWRHYQLPPCWRCSTRITSVLPAPRDSEERRVIWKHAFRDPLFPW